MKNILYLFLIIMSLIGCEQKSKTECSESIKRVDIRFHNALFGKVDVLELKNITSFVCLFYDSLAQYKYVTPILIDQTFGHQTPIDTISINEIKYDYAFVNQYNDSIYVAKAITISKVDSCFMITAVEPFNEIADFVNVANAQIAANKEEEKNKPKEKEFRQITTIADGFDVKRVNLFDSTDGNTRKVISYCTNNEKVEVIYRMDGYVKVRKKDGVEGWCLEGFLK